MNQTAVPRAQSYWEYPMDPRVQGQNEQVLKALIHAMEGESGAIDFYTRLATMAPNKMAKDVVEHALNDEKKHLEAFVELYKALTGKTPKYKTPRTKFSNFKEGVWVAYNDELEAYETYRDDYLLSNDQMIRDTFFLAMTDEIEHAMRFGLLYQML